MKTCFESGGKAPCMQCLCLNFAMGDTWMAYTSCVTNVWFMYGKG